MRKNLFIRIILTAIVAAGCHKAPNTTPAADFVSLEESVITDFTNNTALSQYSSLSSLQFRDSRWNFRTNSEL
jgi:hypothetical protein